MTLLEVHINDRDGIHSGRDIFPYPMSSDHESFSHYIYESGGGFEIYENNSGLSFTGPNLTGVYSHEADPSRFEVFVTEVSLVPEKKKGLVRRPSIALTYTQEEVLRQKAKSMGATFQGKGSWRVMLRKIMSGEIRLTKRGKKTEPFAAWQN